MSKFSKILAALFAYTAVWGSFESYHKMREHEFLSLGSIGHAALSVALMVLGVLITKAASDE